MLSNASSLDTTLALVGYSLQILAEILKKLGKYDWQSFISRLPSFPSLISFITSLGFNPKAFAKLKYLLLTTLTGGASKYADIGSAASTAVSTIPISTRLATFSSLISDVRIFNRLWGMVPLIDWLFAIIRDIQSGNYGTKVNPLPPPPKFDRYLNNLKLWSLIFYQPLENIAYLGNHKIIKISAKTEMALWCWSSRFWAAYVILELIRLSKDYLTNYLYQSNALKSNSNLTEKSKKNQSGFINNSIITLKTLPSNWYKDLLINLSYLPLTAHWSIETGCLDNLTVGVLGATAAAANIGPTWVNVIKGKNLK